MSQKILIIYIEMRGFNWESETIDYDRTKHQWNTTKKLLKILCAILKDKSMIILKWTSGIDAELTFNMLKLYLKYKQSLMIYIDSQKWKNLILCEV